MKKVLFLLGLVLCALQSSAQLRNVNKLTLESTYSYTDIHKSLRDVVDGADKSSYFDDDFFNNMLKKIVSDKQFSDKEKAQLFFLMQKKLGFGFFGVAYLPPKQNYFECQAGKIMTYEKTKSVLRDLHYNVKGLLSLVDSNLHKDPIVASNALLLASLLNSGDIVNKLQEYSTASVILGAKNPDIFNHYVCLSASLVQDSVIISNLEKNLTKFENAEYIEDVLCAIYAKNHSFSKIKEYILEEKNEKNTLSIETALCILYAKVPEATFEKSLKSFIFEAKDKWKTEHMKKLYKKQIPFGYSGSSSTQIASKVWPGVKISNYAEGILVTDGALLEFDAN